MNIPLSGPVLMDLLKKLKRIDFRDCEVRFKWNVEIRQPSPEFVEPIEISEPNTAGAS